MANRISTASDLVAAANLLSAQFISGKLDPETPLAVIDKDSGEVSILLELKIEDHFEGQGNGEDDEQVLVGRTLWAEVEAQ